MSGKKLINSAESAVDEALDGLTFIHPGLRRLQGHRVILREKVDNQKVALLSGGGSGHEPFCAGYIGAGMLTAGVAGSVFASPPTSSILEGIRAIAKDNKAGVLIIVINYTGDRINFGLALEKARHQGIKVDMFVCGEDCALTTADKTAGRRGLCGTMFVFKIVGAMAERGDSLEDLVKTSKCIGSNMGTMGLALGPCSLPGQGPLFQVADDVIEIGLGVHGEAGVGQMTLPTAHDAVKKLIDHMTSKTSATRLDLVAGEQIAVILNNLGGTSKLEELILAREIVTQLEGRGYKVVRFYAGHLMTSLEMSGILISILKVTKNPEWLELLDAPTSAPAWPTPLHSVVNGPTRFNPQPIPVKTQEKEKEFPILGVTLSAEGADKVTTILSAASKALIDLEARLNQLDSGCGDGDCGSTHAQGARVLADSMGTLDTAHPRVLLRQLGVLAEKMGGSSGGVYSLLFTGAAKAFMDHVSGDVEREAWVRALRYGLETVMKYGGAEPGDRTMIDALHPALLILEQAGGLINGEVLSAAGKAATQGAENTASMVARAGRASYVSRDKVHEADPGAIAASTWFNIITDTLK